MAANHFYHKILDTLQGDTEELRAIPRERLDWAGPGALLDLYRKTSGANRRALIGAIGQVIQKHEAPLPVLAQLIQFAASLDLAEVEPEVRQLQSQPLAAEEPLRGAISNYLAFRQLAFTPDTVTPAPTKMLPRRAAKTGPARGNGRTRSR